MAFVVALSNVDWSYLCRKGFTNTIRQR